MVKSDGKLTDVNFYQTEKIRLSRRTTRRKITQKKNRPIRPVQLRYRGLVPWKQ